MRPQITRRKDKSRLELSQSDHGSAEHLPKDSCKADRDLFVLTGAWPTLPRAIKAGIMAMVKAASGSG
jgi:hypothetical protein